ncbi:MAG: hypothetical protein PUP92_11420 [Rhizonema sp. PD38]|nr:hypothetical protein [Rhizonema sp. PD38]
MIQNLLEPCDHRITYGQKQREAASLLGKSVRTIRRLVKKCVKQKSGNFQAMPSLSPDATANGGLRLC